MSILKKISIIFIVLAGSILLTEAYFQFQNSNDPMDESKEQIEEVMNARIMAFFKGEKKNIFDPPYSIFSNSGCSESERVKMIDAYQRYPSGVSSLATNFLDPKHGTFRININQSGVRDKNRSMTKKPGTKTVLLAGSYQAYGYGMNQDEALGPALERALNKTKENHYEVWSVGYPSGTLIMSMGFLNKEGRIIQPDLIVLDIGQVDPFIPFDVILNLDTASKNVKLEDQFLRRKPQWINIVHKGYRFVNKSQVVRRIKNLEMSILRKKTRKGIADCFSVLRESFKVPIILINQPNTATSDYHKELAKEEDFGFFDIKDALDSVKSAEIPDWWADFVHTPGALPYLKNHPFYSSRSIYLKDYYQLNSIGTEKLATGLSSRIKSLIGE